MKIQKLSLQNFSSHPLTQITFTAPVAMIVGSLNAGKSSIAQSLEWALTGNCTSRRKATDSQADLISPNQHNCSVGVQTDRFTVRRSWSVENVGAFEFEGKTLPDVKSLDMAVTSNLGISKATLSAILNTSDFFNLPQADQKELVIALTGATVTHEKLQALFKGEPAALQLLKGRIDSLSALDNAYDYAYQRRTVVKREQKELVPPAAPDGPAPPLQKLQELLAQYQAQLEAKIAEKSRLEGAASVVSVRQQLESKKKILQADIAAPMRNVADLKKERQAIDDQVTAAEKSLQEAKETLLNAKTDVRLREQNIKLLEQFKGTCVAGDHPCPAPLADMQAAKKQQMAAMGKSLDDQYAAEASVTRFNDQRNKLADKVRTADQALSAAESDSKYRDRLKAELAEVEAGLQKADGPQVDRAKIEALEAELTDLRTRMANGRQKIAEAQSWVERQRAVNSVAEARKKVETELRHLESLVEFLGPKGVKVQLIDERIGSFVEGINQYLIAFGFDMKLTVDPWQIVAKGQPLARLSRSERFRLGIAFQIAIAKMTGFGVVVIDDAEILTPEARGQMMKMLVGCGCQVFVLQTLMVSRAEFKHPEHPAIEWFYVSNTDGKSVVEKI